MRRPPERAHGQHEVAVAPGAAAVAKTLATLPPAPRLEREQTLRSPKTVAREQLRSMTEPLQWSAHADEAAPNSPRPEAGCSAESGRSSEEGSWGGMGPHGELELEP